MGERWGGLRGWSVGRRGYKLYVLERGSPHKQNMEESGMWLYSLRWRLMFTSASKHISCFHVFFYRLSYSLII